LRRIFNIALVMGTISVAVCAVTLTILYQVSVSQLGNRFSDMAREKAAVIEMLLEYGKQHRSMAVAKYGGIPEMVIVQANVLKAGARTLGRTGEFALAAKAGDSIHYLIRRRQQEAAELVDIPLSGAFGGPMRRALAGIEGLMKGTDYRGVPVLAAYTPVRGINWGVVVKMDMSEVRAPFIRAGLYSILACLILVGLGAFVIYRMGVPIAKSIEESSLLYRGMFDSTADAVLLLDPALKILDVNISAQNLLGNIQGSFNQIVEKDSLAPLRASIIAVADAGVGTIQANIHRRDGLVFPAEVKITPMKGNRSANILVSIRDLTERIRAEESRLKMEINMQHTQKLESLGVLAGGIAHDFNNLLMAILGNADLAQLEIPAGGPGRQRIENIIAATHRAAELSQQMLAYSGHGKFVVERLDITAVVQDICQLIEVSLSKKAVITYNLKKGLPLFEADAVQLRQVVMNLVMNASEAIGDKSGRISLISGAMECDRNYMDSVSTKDELPEGMYVYLEVSDTGCGMSEEVKSKLYDPFFTTKFTGRGLGMSAVLGIMRGHKGTIKVYSEVGRGTTIKVLFPAIRDTSAAAESELQKKNTWTGEGKILLADDDETIRVVVKAMLEGLGFSVETAVDGRDCLEKYRRSGAHFTAVIVDLTMPHMGGEEVFSGIRQIDKGARVILSSGYNEQEVISRFVGKGLAGFLKKPYRREELQAKLKEVLGS